MFLKSENPELFAHVVSAYNAAVSPKERIFALTAQQLTDEQCAKITKLHITASTFDNVKNLSGIEKLVNLEEFSMPGQNAHTNIDSYEGTIQRMKTVPDYDATSDMQWYRNSYNACQIEDVSPLFACKKLRVLNLSDQRKIEKIDFSNNPNLEIIKMTNCDGLREIVGLDKLSVLNEKKDVFKFMFEFSGSDNIKNIDNFKELANLLANNPNYYCEPTLFLPNQTYFHLVRNYPNMRAELTQYERDSLPIVKWTEICPGNIRVENNSSQLDAAKNRIDEILRTVNSEDSNDSEKGIDDLTKLARVYRWICDNITYDYEGLNKAEVEDPRRKNRIRDSIRSSLVALYSNTAVCVGISNLLGVFMADLGFEHYKVTCSSSKEQSSELTISNHQISKILTSDGKVYYCDPTWDLGAQHSKYFFLNKEELEQDHNLTVADIDVAIAPSFQQALASCGLLETSQYNKQLKNSQQRAV